MCNILFFLLQSFNWNEWYVWQTGGCGGCCCCLQWQSMTMNDDDDDEDFEKKTMECNLLIHSEQEQEWFIYYYSSPHSRGKIRMEEKWEFLWTVIILSDLAILLCYWSFKLWITYSLASPRFSINLKFLMI